MFSSDSEILLCACVPILLSYTEIMQRRITNGLVFFNCFSKSIHVAAFPSSFSDTCLNEDTLNRRTSHPFQFWNKIIHRTKKFSAVAP